MITYIEDDVIKNELQRGYAYDVDDTTELYYLHHINDAVEVSDDIYSLIS